MIALMWCAVWLVPLLVGTAVVLATHGPERRWAAVASLVVALIGAAGLGVATAWGGHPLELGPLSVNVIAVTVGPAMLLGAGALVLVAGRAEAASPEPAWLLGVVALESVALMSGSFLLLVLTECAATIVLALHARNGRNFAHFTYLMVAALMLAVVAAITAAGPPSAQGGAAVLAVVAALVRLGVFPFSTGMLATLQRGPTLSAVLASLPFGGVLLVIHSHAALSEVPGASHVIVAVLLVTSALAAALAISQKDLGRSFGYMLAATHGLIIIGALDPAGTGQLGGELLWAGALLTATGFSAAANLVYLRIGSPDLDQHHGLHASAPFLSLAFLMLGVGLAGAPGTVEFVAEDILLNTASSEGIWGMALVVVTIALVGFNVLRLQFRIFFGVSRPERPYLETKGRERLGLLLVATAVFLGGVAPSLMPLVSAASAAAGH